MTLEEQLHNFIQCYADARRLVICEPEQADAVQAVIEQAGAAGLWTVCPSVLCPPGKLYLLNENAIRSALYDGYPTGPRSLTYPPRTEEK